MFGKFDMDKPGKPVMPFAALIAADPAEMESAIAQYDSGLEYSMQAALDREKDGQPVPLAALKQMQEGFVHMLELDLALDAKSRL